jgi:flagellar biosynthetic protein FliR
MLDIGLETQKFVLVFVRVLAMVWLLPLFDSRTVAAGYKMGLSLIIAFLLFQNVPNPAVADSYLLLLGVAKEALIGISIGFFVRTLFAMVTAAGEVVSMQSGLGFARAMDPTMLVNVTVLEQFKSLLAIMIFFGIDGHHVLLRGITVSLREIPLGAVVVRPALFQFMVSSTAKLFAASLKICAPVVVTLFLVDLSLGMLARMIPQVNVFIEGASMKILIAIGLLAVSLNLIVPVIVSVFRGMDGEIIKIMRCLV